MRGVKSPSVAAMLFLIAIHIPSDFVTDSPLEMSQRPQQLFKLIGPGILVAATGVGAGDLGTAGFTGAKLGVTVMWAVVLGAFLKFVMNEGLTRWQLATDTTLLEGCVRQFGVVFRWLFLLYLLLWSFFVGMALMSACGATWHAILPVFQRAQDDKVMYGIIHSLLAIVLIWKGGYRLFEKVMSVCIGIMFVDVVVTAIALKPSLTDLAAGLFVPQLPSGDGLDWTIALLGGVGGTLTILCYGYWIREEQRSGESALSVCRVDLAIGYLMTAVFGISIMIIGSQLENLDSRGVTLLVEMANQLEGVFGTLGGLAKWAFLLGAWGAVFSSLLGVWQSIPYLFADFCQISHESPPEKRTEIDTQSLTYRCYLIGIGVVPIVGLIAVPFEQATKWNAMLGALIVPILAAILLWLNNHRERMPKHLRNALVTNIVLFATLGFFLFAGWLTIQNKFF